MLPAPTSVSRLYSYTRNVKRAEVQIPVVRVVDLLYTLQKMCNNTFAVYDTTDRGFRAEPGRTRQSTENLDVILPELAP